MRDKECLIIYLCDIYYSFRHLCKILLLLPEGGANILRGLKTVNFFFFFNLMFSFGDQQKKDWGVTLTRKTLTVFYEEKHLE